MRLLERDDTGGFRLTKPLPNDAIPPPYAILSHTWKEEEEVLFSDLADGTAKNKPGYAKLRFCRDQTERDGLEALSARTRQKQRYSSMMPSLTIAPSLLS
ncbi:hypothetical protein B0T25DRAFT_60258 [Lasiosphaeria hispida]|uniref:Uncharacterized protein n=1 Tax=Lasiosphaeria hispida TaxID=260671 RepID=A0AAJ0HWR4_9PEZI|nr:hypothetical protein B0T25DRAFT_60258 [Lasiosphaeria hispida]